MTDDKLAATDHKFGSVSLVTDHDDVTVKRAWLRGEWWDYLHDFWDDCAITAG